jgi:hypothetical protein
VAILQSGWRLRSNSIAGRVWVSSFRAYAIAAMMLVGGVLRFSFLASKSLWLDEAVTAQRVSLPLRQLITVSARTEMPLYHLVVYG